MPARDQQSLDYLFLRVPVGTRLNRTVVKVLKSTAEYLDMPFSGLLESIAVAALQGECFFGPESLKQVEKFKEIYGMNVWLDHLGEDTEGDNVRAADLTAEDVMRQIDTIQQALKGRSDKTTHPK